MGSLSDAQRALLDDVLARHGLDRPTPRPDDLDRRVVHTDPGRLTPRQVEVLALVADGYTNERIARELGIATETVKSHIRTILLAMPAACRAHAVALAIRTGLIE